MRLAHAPQPLTSLYSTGGGRKYLTPPERARFIAASNRHARPEVRTFCLVLAFTGCRISEALSLVAASIEAEECFIAIRCLKKRGRTVIRQIPVPCELIALLQTVHAAPCNGDRLWTWSRSRAWQLVRGLMVDARIVPGVHATPKGLRHGYGVHAIRSGVPLNLVQRWMGHASMTTTAIYLDVIGDEEREIASRMWQ